MQNLEVPSNTWAQATIIGSPASGLTANCVLGLCTSKVHRKVFKLSFVVLLAAFVVGPTPSAFLEFEFDIKKDNARFSGRNLSAGGK
jgi:hypothetical protein